MSSFPAFLYDIVYERNKGLVYIVSLVDSLYHLILGYFVRAGLYHDDLLCR